MTLAFFSLVQFHILLRLWLLPSLPSGGWISNGSFLSRIVYNLILSLNGIQKFLTANVNGYKTTFTISFCSFVHFYCSHCRNLSCVSLLPTFFSFSHSLSLFLWFLCDTDSVNTGFFSFSFFSTFYSVWVFFGSAAVEQSTEHRLHRVVFAAES